MKPSILIVKSSALGDIAQTLPVLDYLKKRFPEGHFGWVVEKPWAELVHWYAPEVELHVVETRRWRFRPWCRRKEIGACVRKLRGRHYDLVFDLQGNTKSAVFTALARADAKVGFGRRSVAEVLNLLVTDHRFDPPEGTSMTRRYVSLVQQYFGDREEFVSAVRNVEGRRAQRLVVAFGSRWENKRLGVEQMRGLLRKAAAELDVELVLVWKEESEREFASAMESELGCLKAVGGLSLRELVELIAGAGGLLCVDSAALHLAALVGTPAFALFGPSEAAVYLPEGEGFDALQGSCPYGIEFPRRCSRLRSCATGACLKALEVPTLFAYLKMWWKDPEKRGRRVTRCTHL